MNFRPFVRINRCLELFFASMRLFTCLLTLACLLPLATRAQGLVFDPVSFNNVPAAPRPTGEKDMPTLPLRIDWSPYCPVPARQTGNTCVAYSTAYGAYAIQRAIDAKLRDDPQAITQRFALSPIYPLLSMGKNCTAGQKLETIADHLAENGDVWLRDVPDLTCADVLPTRVSPQKLVKKPLRVFKNNDSKSYWTKYYVSLGLPVVVGLELTDGFRKLSEAADYYEPVNDKTAKPLLHAVVVVGYDEFRKAFKLLNSYGPNWGQDGFFWMKYAAFDQVARCGIIMPLADSEPVLKPNQHRLGGTFRFVNLADDGNSLQADTVRPHHVAAGLYQLDRKNWKQGDMFQLVTQSTRPGEYMCVFSFSPGDSPNVHYPRRTPHAGGQPTASSEETDLMPMAGYQMVIPSPNDALVIKQATTDYVCVLYSTNPLLADLPGILERMRQTPGDVQTRLRRALGSRLVSQGIEYEPDRMAFSAIFEKGDIVPLVLEVKSAP